jgi:hypothetical protein
MLRDSRFESQVIITPILAPLRAIDPGEPILIKLTYQFPIMMSFLLHSLSNLMFSARQKRALMNHCATARSTRYVVVSVRMSISVWAFPPPTAPNARKGREDSKDA